MGEREGEGGRGKEREGEGGRGREREGEGGRDVREREGGRGDTSIQVDREWLTLDGGNVWRRGTEVAAGTGDGEEDRRSRNTNV